MDLDALLHNYFGTTEIDDLPQDAIDAGRERLAVAFGTERDAGRRFALWTLLHGLGDAPDPAAAFKDTRVRDAAYAYSRAVVRAEASD